MATNVAEFVMTPAFAKRLAADVWTVGFYRDQKLLTSITCDLDQVQLWLNYFRTHPEVEPEIRAFNRVVMKPCGPAMCGALSAKQGKNPAAMAAGLPKSPRDAQRTAPDS